MGQEQTSVYASRLVLPSQSETPGKKLDEAVAGAVWPTESAPTPGRKRGHLRPSSTGHDHGDMCDSG